MREVFILVVDKIKLSFHGGVGEGDRFQFFPFDLLTDDMF
jgi:hypothetical protein